MHFWDVPLMEVFTSLSFPLLLSFVFVVFSSEYEKAKEFRGRTPPYSPLATPPSPWGMGPLLPPSIATYFLAFFANSVQKNVLR